MLLDVTQRTHRTRLVTHGRDDDAPLPEGGGACPSTGQEAAATHVAQARLASHHRRYLVACVSHEMSSGDTVRPMNSCATRRDGGFDHANDATSPCGR